MTSRPQDSTAAPDTSELAARTEEVARAIVGLEPEQRIIVERILAWITSMAETVDQLAQAVAGLNTLDDIREAEIKTLHSLVTTLAMKAIADQDDTHSRKVS